jgi:hypothetical protein
MSFIFLVIKKVLLARKTNHTFYIKSMVVFAAYVKSDKQLIIWDLLVLCCIILKGQLLFR